MLKDFRYAIRMLSKNPGFAATAILSLAIGIGATSSMYSFANTLLLRPLPVLEPDRVLAVHAESSAAFGLSSALSYPDYVDLRDQNNRFSGLLACADSTFGFSPNARSLPQMKFGMYVSGNFFRDLGVIPALGRDFRADEDQAPGRDPVVVLGHDFWVTQFAASPTLIGSNIRLNGVDLVVIGVAPEAFTGVDNFLRPSFFVPIAMSPRLSGTNNLEIRDARWLTVKGRLKPGATLAQAQADIGAIASRLQTTYPLSNRDQRLVVQTELRMRIQQNPPNATLLAMLGLLSACVLLVACANVAGLLLSRSRARSREIATRLAVGASRSSLISQLLIESLVLALAGGSAGMFVAFAGTRYFSSLPIPSDLPIVLAVTVDRSVLFFTIAISLISTLLFGLAPAIRTTRPDLVPALKSADSDSAGKRRLWGRNAIVVGQVALSLVLLVMSAVLLQGFRSQLLQGPGFRTSKLFLTSFDTQLVHYTEEETQRFYKDLLDQVRSAPGVRSAALSSVVPLIGGDGVGIVPEGVQLPHGERSFNVFDSYVGDGFFETMNIPLTKGRGFLVTDKENTPMVAVVEEHLASHYWPNGIAVGKRFHLRNETGPLVQIVGIARTSKHLWIAEPPIDYVYLSYRQNVRSALTLFAESNSQNAFTILPAIRKVVKKLDPNMPVYDSRTMESFYTERAVKVPKMIANTVAGLGVMGLILAMIGLYGLISYSVSRRTREIGIRMAIGASRFSVARMVLTEGFILGALGVAAGLTIAIPASGLVTSSMAWVAAFTSSSYWIFVAVAIPLLVMTLLATYAPARRASLIDPVRALRDE